MATVKTRAMVTALLLWNASTVLAACVDPDLASCTTAYTGNLQTRVITDRDAFCGVLQKYRTCVDKICDTIPEDFTRYFVKAQTHYFDCGIGSAPALVALSSLFQVLMAVFIICVLH